jgi:hypothetical protein
MKKSGVCLAALAVFALWTAQAPADGESRPAKPGEKAFYANIYKVFEKACPPAPQGWREDYRDQPFLTDSVGIGAEFSPLTAVYSLRFQDDVTKRAADVKMLDAGGKVMNAHLENAARDALMKKMEAIAAEMGAAAQSGNIAGMQARQQEMEDVQTKLAKIQEANDQELNTAVSPHLAKDVTLDILIRANVFSEEFYEVAPEALDPVGGFPACRHREGRQEGTVWEEGMTYVFLGNWLPPETSEDVTRVRSVSRAGAPHTEVQTLVVSVKGEAKRARAALEAMDWAALKGLLGKEPR